MGALSRSVAADNYHVKSIAAMLFHMTQVGILASCFLSLVVWINRSNRVHSGSPRYGSLKLLLM